MLEKEQERQTLAERFLKGQISRREFMKRAGILGIGAGAMTTLLSACGGAAATPAAKGTTAAGTTKDQLTFAISATPPGWDNDINAGVGADEIELLIHDTLVRWKSVPYSKEAGGFFADTGAADYTKSFEPRLAESWKTEGSTHIFSLRKGVISHAGNEMTADDVKWTYERSFKLQAIGFFLNFVAGLKSIDDVKVIDKYTVSFTIAQPKDIFFNTLAVGLRAVLDSTEMKKHATADDPYALKWAPTGDAGFGRYKLVSLEPGKQLTMESWDKHYLGAAKVKRLIFREVPSSANRLTLIQKGEVDATRDLLPREYESLKGKAGTRVWNLPGTNQAVYQLSPLFPPLDIAKVRQALSYAAPYDSVLKDVYKGFATKAGGPLPDTFQGYKDVQIYNTDLDKAKSLLKEAGFPNGFSIEMGYNADLAVHEQMAVLFQTNLDKIGVKASLKARPSLEYYEGQTTPPKEKKTPITVYSEGAFVPDPYYVGFLFYHSQSPINPAKVNIKALDDLLNQMATQADRTKLLEQAVEMQKLIVNEAAWIFLAQPGIQVATSDKMKGAASYLAFLDYGSFYLPA